MKLKKIQKHSRGIWENPQEKGTMAGTAVGFEGTAEFSGTETIEGYWKYVPQWAENIATGKGSFVETGMVGDVATVQQGSETEMVIHGATWVYVSYEGGSDLTTSIGARGGRNQKDSLIKAIDINSPQWRQYKQALQILAAAEMAEVGAFISSAGGIALLAGGPMVAVAAVPVILGGVVLVGGGVIIFLDAIGYEKPLTTIQSWVRK